MSHPLSLAFLTISDVEPPQAVEIAAAAGYDFVGLRLLPAAPGERSYPILDDESVLVETLARLRDTGIKVGDIEIARLKPETVVTDFTPFLERGARLGAHHVLVAGDDPNQGRLTDTFAAFAALAAQFNLTADLEFMPWTAVPDLAHARAIVAGAGAPNGGVLIDALHFDRARSTLDEVVRLPAKMMHYVQLCDGPATFDPDAESLIRVARGERLFPGEGEINLGGLIATLSDDMPLSIEVPNLDLNGRRTPQQRADQAMLATRQLLALVGRA